MKQEITLKIGDALKFLMKEKGLTLKDISQKTGVPISTLSEWSRNHRNPNVVQVQAVSRFLGVSVHRLLFDEEDAQEPLAKVLSTEIFRGVYEITLKKVKLPE